MSTRAYASPKRAAQAAERREAVLRSATQLIREQCIADFSLDAVAKAAGVTRLTVYNQFGSRPGLLQAVLDEIARNGRIERLRAAMALPDASEGLALMIETMCDFWSADPAIAKLHEVIGVDQEFGEALLERNERRRKIMDHLLGRILPKGAPAATRREVVDLIFSLTSCATYQMLSANRPKKAVRDIVLAASRDAIARASRGK